MGNVPATFDDYVRRFGQALAEETAPFMAPHNESLAHHDIPTAAEQVMALSPAAAASRSRKKQTAKPNEVTGLDDRQTVKVPK